MSTRTVLNKTYKGVVERFPIPAELHEVEGRRFASVGSVVPIHCCTPAQIEERAKTSHHYCDVFSDDVLAQHGELAYVRLDDESSEKVFLNRSKRILLTSSDGKLAQWRCAPTFESPNDYIAGAPILNQEGQLASVVTVKRGNHYAVSTLEGEGGYFETSEPWEVYDIKEKQYHYADRAFSTREELRAYVESLPPRSAAPPRPVLWRGARPRVALVGAEGTQLAHVYLAGVLADDVQYL